MNRLGQLVRTLQRQTAQVTHTENVHTMDYADGFKHGFDAGRTACIGDISVTTLIKELIDRGDLEFASKLLDELKDRA